ncbi:MAG TPA: alpha-amylase family glycosyl hydrolase, partial [Elainellaceae cyanobacterium]
MVSPLSQSSSNLPNQKLDELQARSPSDDDIDLEFLYTRDIEFRQETVYFIVVDRFFDGDPSNNEGPNPELYDPTRTEWGKYWGGDLQGVISKLDYLKNMGVTAIWLTPLFEQIEELFIESAAIHGYWAQDFKRINPRFIRTDDDPSLNNTQEARNTIFDELIEKMHQRDMKLVLDIVCNHSSPDVSGTKGVLYDDGELIADFNNDVNHWYHHYG